MTDEPSGHNWTCQEQALWLPSGFLPHRPPRVFLPWASPGGEELRRLPETRTIPFACRVSYALPPATAEEVQLATVPPGGFAVLSETAREVLEDGS